MFHARLLAAREHAGLTRAQLIDTLDQAPHPLTEQRLQSLELGDAPPPNMEETVRLAKALHVSHLWLVTGDLAPTDAVPSWWGQKP
jgi:transcriptional regulator with XRE-family HTH domain